MLRSIKLACNQSSAPVQDVSGLAMQAHCLSFRPSLFPISASVDRSGSDKRNRTGSASAGYGFPRPNTHSAAVILD